MGTSARIAFRGAAIASLTAVAACGGVSSSPTPTAVSSTSEATPTSSQVDVTLTETFTSNLHGYSVLYPAGWSATSGTAPWEAGAPGNNWGSPVLDDLRGSTLRLTAASQQLAAGQTATAWLSTYASHGTCQGSDPTTWPTIPVGGQVGVMSADGCSAATGTIVSGGRLFDVVVFVGGRAYNFTLDGIADHAFVESILATVVFDPTSAAS